MELKEIKISSNEAKGKYPDDWSIETVDKFARIITGNKDTQDRQDGGKYPFFVRSSIIERINSFSFDGEAVLTSGDGVGVGKIYHYIDGKFDFHQRVYNIHNFRENVSGLYFYYYFSNNFYDRVMSMTAKSSVDSVRREMISNMEIPLPPTLEEQQAIATALSEVDTLISKLDKLIAKKKAIKQGAIQRLLKSPEQGGQRLRGFEGEWRETTIGELVDFLDGSRRPIKSGDRERMQGIYPYYGASGIIDYVNDYLFDDDLILLGEDGENILSRNLRLAFKVSGKIWVNNHAHVLKPKSGVDIDFLTELLESLDYELYNSGTAQPKLNKRTCSFIPLEVPDYQEQKAISAILSDMDKEIESLETKKSKYLHIKQGMMQELLTGKTRLV